MSTYFVYPKSEQEKLMLAFFEEHQIFFDKDNDELPDHVIEGIRKSQEDVKAGRTISYEEFKARLSIIK